MPLGIISSVCLTSNRKENGQTVYECNLIILNFRPSMEIISNKVLHGLKENQKEQFNRRAGSDVEKNTELHQICCLLINHCSSSSNNI